MRSYHDFVIERHKIWEKRLLGLPAPWTDDPIMASNSFTNVFRVLDYGSQYLLKMLNDHWGPQEVFFRCAMYRFTNRPEPWEYFYQRHDGFPLTDDVHSGKLRHTWAEYGQELRGSAYQITIGLENKGMTYVDYLTQVLAPAIIGVMNDFVDAGSLEERVTILQRIPRCGPFMAMQIATDFGYWDPTFSANDYILPGPGTLKGVALVNPFSKHDPDFVIRDLRSMWEEYQTVTLAGLPPSLMDVANSLCEYQKYHRWSQANQIGKYVPKHLNEPDPFIPRHMKAARS